MIAQFLTLILQVAQPTPSAEFSGQTGVHIDSSGLCIITKPSGYPSADRRACEILRQCSEGKRALKDCSANTHARKSDDAIDVPYQIMPAYSEYVTCVGNQLKTDPRHGSADVAAARQANVDAIAACKDVRAYQLARALRLQTDHRLYGSRKKAEAAIQRAFDRFDAEFVIEPITGNTNA